MTLVYSEWEELGRVDDRIRKHQSVAEKLCREAFPGARLNRKVMMHEDWLVPCVEWQWSVYA